MHIKGYFIAKNSFVAEVTFNSIRKKFELLSEQVRGNVDVLMVSETKIDGIFSIGNFLIHGFSPPYRLDRDLKGGGIMLYNKGRYSFKPSSNR